MGQALNPHAGVERAAQRQVLQLPRVSQQGGLQKKSPASLESSLVSRTAGAPVVLLGVHLNYTEWGQPPPPEGNWALRVLKIIFRSGVVKLLSW